MSEAPEKWEFDQPFELIQKDNMPGTYWLYHQGSSVATFSITNFGDHQSCLEAAWRFAYEPEPDEEDLNDIIQTQAAEIARLREGLVAIADPLRIDSYGDPGVLRAAARSVLEASND